VTELRWVLVLLGLGVFAGIYLWGKRKQPQLHHEEDAARVEPSLQDSPDWHETHPDNELTRQDDTTFGEELPIESDADETVEALGEPSRILVVHVRAALDNTLSGASLMAAMQKEGLRRASHGAFELPSESGMPLYTVASMVEPGTFPEDKDEDFATPGITAFMVLPGPGGVEALAGMIESARRIAKDLGGEVLDETGSTLTNQGATHLREQVIEFQRRSQIGLSNK
jgi:cell division protein ZipA